MYDPNPSLTWKGPGDQSLTALRVATPASVTLESEAKRTLSPTELSANENIIEERKRYSEWRAAAAHLYDFMAVQTLAWPSLTIEWLSPPDAGWKDYCTSPAQSNVELHRIVYATHAAEDENNKNYVTVAQLYIPGNDDLSDGDEMNDEELLANPPTFDESDTLAVHVKPIIQIQEHLEVNRVRSMPQSPSVIACKTMAGDIHIYNVETHIDESAAAGMEILDAEGNNVKQIEPDVNLTGHQRDGYGLSWNRLRKGYIASGSDDHLVIHWDANAPNHSVVSPLHIYRGHDDIVNDVQWLPGQEQLFASVGDDGVLFKWDVRTKSNVSKIVEVHGNCAVNSLSFSPHEFHHFVTASSRGDVALWDDRKADAPVHKFVFHKDEVLQLEWDPFHDGIFASCGGDKRVCVWNTKLIDQLPEANRMDEAPPELCFVHGGHTDKVLDLSWCPTRPYTIVSCAEDNIMHMWEMNPDIFE